MSHESRTTIYVYIVTAIGGVIASSVLVGVIQEWKAEVYAEIFASIAITASIVFLVIDKIMFDKPHFRFVHWKLKRADSVLLPTNQILFFYMQNDGFRDASSVRARIEILSDDYKRQGAYVPPMQLLTDKKFSETQAIRVQTGDDFQLLLPTSKLQYDYNDKQHNSGRIYVRILTAFVWPYFFFTYEWQQDGKWKIEPSFFPFYSWIRYAVSNRRSSKNAFRSS